ncbi:glycoside hydrolase family 88 protein [Paraflavitalea sp. CAU 1676]|uniref:glycoside hydrolase family 88 protein n=1 Tax=Paraflavitalea sp. CAU 1676 TaxID=3032598 RepID=UPI0023DBBACA|nr:glycoside hydrolase family 88 protein [Paraflavitalea sp. CAU 1676]MDF2190371.1 glycoside hydrolase family 88 protein [Paraflavitalea sp. CAU 1676]
MKQMFVCAGILSLCLLGFTTRNSEADFVKENFKYANKQLKTMLQETGNKQNAFPRTINKAGKLVTTNMYDWTPGFFPGSLWNAYEYMEDTEMKTAARTWTEQLEPLKTFTGHHDLGFMMYCSYGNAYQQTGNDAYKNILVQSARSLSTRFNPTTGCIKSWNTFKSWHGNKTYNFPVIIDNMMNLELLFFASKVTGDTSYRHVAVSHAVNTMKYQIRKDYSSFHVVCYDTINGKVAGQETAQGYADNSTWSRGQAWGIYGFTMVYRETRDPRFLKTAQGMADFFIRHKNLPADKVPYWDFNANQAGYTPGVNSNARKVTQSYRDASAAAIVASALFELSTYVSGAKSKEYKNAAIKMLHSLGSDAYRAKPGTNGNFLLMHCVGSIPHNGEIDVPLVYADYYFLEALNRYDRLLKGESLFAKG